MTFLNIFCSKRDILHKRRRGDYMAYKIKKDERDEELIGKKINKLIIDSDSERPFEIVFEYEALKEEDIVENKKRKEEKKNDEKPSS